MSTVLGTAAMLDSVGRFTSNVGVPAAIALFVVWQISPRLDAVALEQRQTNTQLTVLSASCFTSRPTITSGFDR
jgi:hypothetical protein